MTTMSTDHLWRHFTPAGASRLVKMSLAHDPHALPSSDAGVGSTFVDIRLHLDILGEPA